MTADHKAVVEEFKADAYLYFSQHLAVELRNSASIEAVAIGRRAADHIRGAVGEVCTPFEEDLEADKAMLNRLFEVAAGGANVTRGLSGGSSGSHPRINMASRVVNIGLSVLVHGVDDLENIKTVGELKQEWTRALEVAAAGQAETTSTSYIAYEESVMDALRQDWIDDTERLTSRMEAAPTAPDAANMGALAASYRATAGMQHQQRLRSEYGARSRWAQAMLVEISAQLEPAMVDLGQRLAQAKTARQKEQALAAIGAGVAGGAALGAAIGASAGGFGALPGALAGAALGGLAGTATAVSVLWD